MGRLLNREGWEHQLPRDVVTALEAWLEDRLFDLDHCGWFTEGRSDDPVARAMRVYPDDTDQLILKFFTEDGVKKVHNIRQARLGVPRTGFVGIWPNRRKKRYRSEAGAAFSCTSQEAISPRCAR